MSTTFPLHRSQLSHSALALGSLLLPFLGTAPLVVVHFLQLWTRPQYQFFPFVLLAVGYLSYQRWWERAVRQPPISHRWAVSLVGAVGVLLLAFATLAWSPWTATFSAIVFAAALVLVVSQYAVVSQAWWIWLLLGLILPLPLGLDESLTQFLQRASSRISSVLLDSLGVLHISEGNVLKTPIKSFFVDEACSGVISLFSIIAVCAIYGVFRRRSTIHIVLLTLTGLIWAVLTNVLRICIIVVAYQWWEIDLTTGAVHEALSLVIFSGAFLGCVATDQFILGGLQPIVAGLAAKQSFLVRSWNRFAAYPFQAQLEQDRQLENDNPASTGRVPRLPMWIGVCSAMLGIFQLYLMPARFQIAPDTAWVSRAVEIDRDFLGDELAGWQISDFYESRRTRNHLLGEYSKVFEAVDPQSGQRVTLSIDFPFREFHLLTTCYLLSGWSLEDRQVCIAPSGSQLEEWGHVEAALVKDGAEYGHLWYADLEGSGNLLQPPQKEVVEAHSQLRRRLRDLFTVSQNHQGESAVIQVQAWIVGGSKADDLKRARVQKLFDAFRMQIHDHFASDVEAAE